MPKNLLVVKNCSLSDITSVADNLATQCIKIAKMSKKFSLAKSGTW